MEFLVLLLCSVVLTARAAAGYPVLDTNGDEVQSGQLYYAMSAASPGGGLTLATRNGSSSSCPAYVAQAPTADLLGRPLTFSPENPSDDTVKEGSTLYVTFPATGDDQCAESSSGTWQLKTLTGFVSIGGSASASIGPHFSRFAIRKAKGQQLGYQISACPCSIGVNRPSCRMGCLGSLGLSGDGASNNHLLSIASNRPHTISFVKVVEQQQQYQPSTKIRSVLVRPRPN